MSNLISTAEISRIYPPFNSKWWYVNILSTHQAVYPTRRDNESSWSKCVSNSMGKLRLICLCRKGQQTFL